MTSQSEGPQQDPHQDEPLMTSLEGALFEHLLKVQEFPEPLSS